MKKLTCVLMFFLLQSTPAQVFTATGGTIPANGGSAANFSVAVSGLNAPADSLYGLEEVCIDIAHPAVEELVVSLRSPSGTEVALTGMKSCKGAGFTNTCFNNQAYLSVTIGVAPFTGTYRPVGNLGRFNRKQAGNGTWQLVIKDITAGGSSGMLNSWSLRFGTNPARPVLLTSSNLPVVQIKTPGAASVTETEVLADVTITDHPGSRNFVAAPANNYMGRAECSVRGSSSRMFEKRNLKLELKDDAGISDREASLCSMPAESDWILTACYTDKTMLRNALSQEIFRRMGHYAPRCRFVELILNDEYYGVYILMEQVKRGKHRVNVDKLTAGEEQFPNVTGGYIIQVDRVNEPGWYSLNPGVSANGAHFFYQYNYPRAEAITTVQKDYIKAVLDSFETAIASPDFSDPQTGFRKFIDESSFIDFFILNELSKNVDAYKLSTYLHKPNALDGGKIHAGPPWDFDLAWHNANFGNAFDENSWQFGHNNSANPIPRWWQRLMEDSVFRDRLYCRYSGLRRDILSVDGLDHVIDSMAAHLEEARERNYRQFPILGAYIWPNPQVSQHDADYHTEIADLKSWILKRTAWLDAAISGSCGVLAVAGTESDETTFDVFPSPFSDILNFSVQSDSPGTVEYEVFSGNGERVLSRQALPVSSGAHRYEIDMEALPGGIYFMKAIFKGQMHSKKIIKVQGH